MTGHAGQSSGRPTAAQGFHEDPEVWAPRLLRILDRQHGLYQRLEGLSRAQGEHIRAERTDSLLEVLGQRQTLIDELGALNEEIAPFVQKWDQIAPLLPERHRAVLRERFASVAALVDEIATRDEADRRTLESKRSEIEGLLRDVPQARGAIAAYGRSAAPGAAVFQDRRG
jgi:flagellar biosynthesis/type III secretory pathway chaperone